MNNEFVHSIGYLDDGLFTVCLNHGVPSFVAVTVAAAVVVVVGRYCFFTLFI